MARVSARTSDGALAQTATAAHFHAIDRRSPLKYLPGFAYILVLYIAGKFTFSDPRATLVQWGEYQLSWVESSFGRRRYDGDGRAIEGLASWDR